MPTIATSPLTASRSLANPQEAPLMGSQSSPGTTATSKARAWRHQLIDAREMFVRNFHLQRAQRAVEMLHHAWADNRRRHCRVAKDPSSGVLGQRCADFFGHAREFFDDVQPLLTALGIELEVVAYEHAELRLVGATRVLRHLLSAPITAAQPPAFERAPDDGTEGEALADREDVALDIAREDRVRRLCGDESLEARGFAHTQRFHHAPARPLQVDGVGRMTGGNADVTNLSLTDKIRQRTERLFDRRVAVVAVQLVQVDPLRTELAQAVLDLLENVSARGAAVGDAAGAGHKYLGGDDDMG